MTIRAASLVLGMFAITSATLSFATIADRRPAAEPADGERDAGREQAAAPEYKFVSDIKIQIVRDRLFARVALVRNNLIDYGGLLILGETPSFHAPIGFPSHHLEAKALSPDGEIIAHTYPGDSSPLYFRSIAHRPDSIIEFDSIHEFEIKGNFDAFVVPAEVYYSPDGESLLLIDFAHHFREALQLQIAFLHVESGQMTGVPMTWAADHPVLWESENAFFVRCIGELVDGSIDFGDFNKGFGRISRQDGDWTVERVQESGIPIGLHRPTKRPIWFTENTVVIGDDFELFNAGDLPDRQNRRLPGRHHRRFRVAAIDTERIALLVAESRLVVIEIENARVLLDHELDDSIVLLAQQERAHDETAAVLGMGDRVAVVDIDTLLAGQDAIDWRKVEVLRWRPQVDDR